MGRQGAGNNKGKAAPRQAGGANNKQKRQGTGQQKRLKDGRYWRNVDVVPQSDDVAMAAGDLQVVWPTDSPSQSAWNAFFAQTDPRRQKVRLFIYLNLIKLIASILQFKIILIFLIMFGLFNCFFLK
jgi:hypothetical protein